MATDIPALDVVSFPGTGETAYLIPRVTPDTEAFWDGLNDGRLTLQRCSACGKPRYPVAPVCPYCRTSKYVWDVVSGVGAVFSWIRYHKSYQPEFDQLMPYVVLCVQLDAGPRMFGRLASDVQPEIGMRVTVIGERWADGRVLPAFNSELEM
jgi:uncharacterized protein